MDAQSVVGSELRPVCEELFEYATRPNLKIAPLADTRSSLMMSSVMRGPVCERDVQQRLPKEWTRRNKVGGVAMKENECLRADTP